MKTYSGLLFVELLLIIFISCCLSSIDADESLLAATIINSSPSLIIASSSSSSSSSSSLVQSQFKCPEQFGYYPDTGNCTKYYVCVFGEALHETCTGGLYFSSELQTCDWPRNVRCASNSDRVDTTDQELTIYQFDSEDKRIFEYDVDKEIYMPMINEENGDKNVYSVKQDYDNDEKNDATDKYREQKEAFNFESLTRKSLQPQQHQHQQESSTPKTSPEVYKEVDDSHSMDDIDRIANHNHHHHHHNNNNNNNNGDNGNHKEYNNYENGGGDSNKLTKEDLQNPGFEEAIASIIDENGGIHVDDGPGGLFSLVPADTVGTSDHNVNVFHKPAIQDNQERLAKDRFAMKKEDKYNFELKGPRVVRFDDDIEAEILSAKTRSNEQKVQLLSPSTSSSTSKLINRLMVAANNNNNKTTQSQSTTAASLPVLSRMPRFQQQRLQQEKYFEKQKVEHIKFSPMKYIKTDDAVVRIQPLTFLPINLSVPLGDTAPQKTAKVYKDSQRIPKSLSSTTPTAARASSTPSTSSSLSSTNASTTTTTTSTTTLSPNIFYSYRNSDSIYRRKPLVSTTSAASLNVSYFRKPLTTSTPSPSAPLFRNSYQQKTHSFPFGKLPSVVNTKVDVDSQPQRPVSLFATPEPLGMADKCAEKICKLPDCLCGGTEIPSGLQAKQIPQIVLITFDDAINDVNWHIYEEIFSADRRNPNGCPIRGTFYVSHEWTDYGQVQTLYSRGHEIASHSITHSFGERFTKSQWFKEINGQRDILHNFGGVKLEDIRGMRAPFLQTGGNKQFEMLYEANFTYDSSMAIFENSPPFWPYTLDYGINHECMIAPCPTKSFAGLWEIGLIMWHDLRGGRCSMGDACSNPTDENGVYDMIMKNFNRHYKSNRAPFGLFYHSAWFNTAHHKTGFLRFVDEVLRNNDVYFVTSWQLLQWIREPTPLKTINNFEPWKCHQQTQTQTQQPIHDRPQQCLNPTVCNVRFKSGSRFFKTCQLCPESYPWIGNSGFTANKKKESN